jgi:hypothetical protein
MADKRIYSIKQKQKTKQTRTRKMSSEIKGILHAAHTCAWDYTMNDTNKIGKPADREGAIN